MFIYFACYQLLIQLFKSESQRRYFASIEFDNKLMLERLATAVQKKSLDNEMHEAVVYHRFFKKKIALTKKRLEMQKITEENQRLLRRIQEVPPVYNHLDWEEEATDRENTLKCMALYPEYYDRLEKEKTSKQSQTMTSSLSKSGGITIRSK